VPYQGMRPFAEEALGEKEKSAFDRICRDLPRLRGPRRGRGAGGHRRRGRDEPAAETAGQYGRTLARLYTLVSRTSGRAQGALERGEELVAQIAALRAGERSAR
jgi:hypothetical protein